MRIVLIGQAAFGAKTLEVLVERGDQVVAVYTPPDGPGGRIDALKEAALAAEIPVFQPASYKDDGAFAQYRDLAPDLTVLAFVTDIIPERYLDLPTAGTICYHPSQLPRHRGASAINWAVIMGDTRTGLTVFWADGGIDTGPILLQKQIDIGPEDTTGSLYFNQLFPMGIEAIAESVDLVKQGKAPSIVQDEGGATYEPPCDDSVAAVDFGRPAAEVYNLVRGCDPQPGAYATWGSERVRFYGAKYIAGAVDAAPGTVVKVAPEGLHVAMDGGTLVVGKIRTASGGKMAAADFATAGGPALGQRFEAGS